LLQRILNIVVYKANNTSVWGKTVERDLLLPEIQRSCHSSERWERWLKPCKRSNGMRPAMGWVRFCFVNFATVFSNFSPAVDKM